MDTIIYGPLAHLVEHLTLNQGVRGSSPRRPTPKSIGFADLELRGRCFFSLNYSDMDSLFFLINVLGAVYDI